jgi:hypothetical protein
MQINLKKGTKNMIDIIKFPPMSSAFFLPGTVLALPLASSYHLILDSEKSKGKKLAHFSGAYCSLLTYRHLTEFLPLPPALNTLLVMSLSGISLNNAYDFLYGTRTDESKKTERLLDFFCAPQRETNIGEKIESLLIAIGASFSAYYCYQNHLGSTLEDLILNHINLFKLWDNIPPKINLPRTKNISAFIQNDSINITPPDISSLQDFFRNKWPNSDTTFNLWMITGGILGLGGLLYFRNFLRRLDMFVTNQLPAVRPSVKLALGSTFMTLGIILVMMGDSIFESKTKTYGAMLLLTATFYLTEKVSNRVTTIADHLDDALDDAQNAVRNVGQLAKNINHQVNPTFHRIHDLLDITAVRMQYLFFYRQKTIDQKLEEQRKRHAGVLKNN